ncbi:hypothetical protein COSO111634_34870 [Corallococcus soli]
MRSSAASGVFSWGTPIRPSSRALRTTDVSASTSTSPSSVRGIRWVKKLARRFVVSSAFLGTNAAGIFWGATPSWTGPRDTAYFHAVRPSWVTVPAGVSLMRPWKRLSKSRMAPVSSVRVRSAMPRSRSRWRYGP